MDKAPPKLQSHGFCGARLYNELRPHQGRWCYGKTPLQTFVDGAPLAHEKMLDDMQERLA
jgi:hypothetical protein